jgi:hypothetical protein
MAVNYEDSVMSRRQIQSGLISEIPDRKLLLKLSQGEKIVSANVETLNDITVYISFMIYTEKAL